MPSRGINSKAVREALLAAKVKRAIEGNLDDVVKSNEGASHGGLDPEAVKLSWRAKKKLKTQARDREARANGLQDPAATTETQPGNDSKGTQSGMKAMATDQKARPKKYSRKTRFSGRQAMMRALDDLLDVSKPPTYAELGDNLTDEKKAVEYLQKQGCIDVHTHCPRCEQPCTPDWKRHDIRCRRKECGSRVPSSCERCLGDLGTIQDVNGNTVRADCDDCDWFWVPGKAFHCSFFRGSFLHLCKLPKNVVLHILYLWLHKIPATTAADMLGLGRKTVGKWYRFIRQIITECILTGDYDNVLLGGPGVIVEIDESKFGKRKYNRGRRANGDWVLGLVERTTRRRIVALVVKDRERATLEPIIAKFVRPYSTIHCDNWKAYDKLEEVENRHYTLKRICHKYEFVANDGTHTNTIEGNWPVMKGQIPLSYRSGNDLQDYLFEFCWRRQNIKKPWGALMDSLSRVRFTQAELDALLDERCEMGEDMDEEYVPSRQYDCDLQVDSGSSFESVTSAQSAPLQNLL